MLILPWGVVLVSNNIRAPAISILANGAPVPGIIEAEICSNSHLAADRFHFRASLAESGPAIWTTGKLVIEILIGLDGAWASLIVGPADRIEIDPIHREVCVDGRDLTARFIASRTQETFENQTASDIVTTLAARQGLSAAVTPTTALQGRYYQNAYSRSSLDQHARASTDWDLLVWLALTEGSDVWVSGQTLNFMPTGQVLSTVPLDVGDCISLSLQRVPDLEEGLAVSVRSWDGRGARSISQTASYNSANSSLPGYIIVRPNLTTAAAQQEAERIFSGMSEHARCISIEMPGELLIEPRMALSLTGSGTDFDRVYVVSEVERRVSFHHGFTQHVRARLPPWTNF